MPCGLNSIARFTVHAGAPPETRGAAVWARQAVLFGQLARHARPVLVTGGIGIVTAPKAACSGRSAFSFGNGKIDEITVISNPARLGELDLSTVEE
jgi:RNA polymerase sigma-70 factor (ECF subfamily)